MGLHRRTMKAGALAILIAVGIGVEVNQAKAAGTETLTVAGGCFWCVEADFEKVEGVQIMYDPAKVSARQLYDLFFRSVDPTDAGGQFCDRGDSYRTAIFVSDPVEKTAASAAKAEAEKALGQKIVTPILEAGPFYEAEAYHQDYYKGEKLILTRFGPKSQAAAYDRYRTACGRDARVKALWGQAAPFVN